MPRLSNRVFAGLSASALSVLMSQTALAAVVSVHVPVPTVHISMPTVHVVAPVVQVKAPVIKTAVITTNQSTSHHDLQDGGDRRGHGTTVGTAKLRSVPFNFEGSLAINRHGDLPRGGRNGGSQTTSKAVTVSKGVTVATTDVPGTNGRNWPRGGNGGSGSPSNPPEAWTWNGLILPYFPWEIYGLQNYEGMVDAQNFFNGEGCTFPSSNNGPGFGHDLKITGASGGAPGSDSITVSWSPQNGSAGGANQGGPIDGTITENANGTYTIIFSWGPGGNHQFTGTITWTPGPNGGGSWTLSGGVTVNGSSSDGPGTGTCTLT